MSYDVGDYDTGTYDDLTPPVPPVEPPPPVPSPEVPLVDPTIVFDLEGSILAAAETALTDSAFGSLPEHRFVAHGRPPDDCCDHLVVWAERIYPTRAFPAILGEPQVCEDVRMAVSVVITYVRNCYPTLVDNRADPFPADADIMAATLKLHTDARLLWCGVMAAYDDGVIYDGIDEPKGDVVWGTMLPRANEGGCAGWEWRNVWELPTCC